MRALATAIMLTGLMWLAYWAARIAFLGAQGTLPMLAFVGGLLAIAGSTAYLSQREERRALDQAENRLTQLRASRPGTNGHKYNQTWPATRTRPWRRKVR